jgi:hypothetical protein
MLVALFGGLPGGHRPDREIIRRARRRDSSWQVERHASNI